MLYFEVIRLEPFLYRLDRIVNGDVHQRDIDESDRTGPSDRDCVHRDLIPIDHCICVGPSVGTGDPRTAEQPAQDESSYAFHADSSTRRTRLGGGCAPAARRE
jgi:hypothetical protein